MKTILLSAFACDPTKGSESGNGWNWALELSRKNFRVYCFTRHTNQQNIESDKRSQNINFNYIKLPPFLENIYGKSELGMYLYYIAWQWKLYREVKKMHSKNGFDLVHHVTWGSLQMGSFLYKIKAPLIFGPSGGGQVAPKRLSQFFGSNWKREMNRERVSKLLEMFNPAFRKMCRKAEFVFVANNDTLKLARRAGAKNVSQMLDCALAQEFFPAEFSPKKVKGVFNLLWVGRFMPRKALNLILEVMKGLKKYSDIKLTVVGDGEMTDEWKRLAKDYMLDNSVNFVGRKTHEQVKEYYRNNHVFLFASLRDSCPAQLVEAMAFGMPVITLNLHGQGIIVQENTGIKCECQTPAQAVANLQNAIVKFYDDPELVTKMSIGAHEFAKKQTWEKKVASIVSQYYPC